MSDVKPIREKKITPKILAEWWQESYNQIRLMYPHESQDFHEQLTERKVQSRIDQYYAQQRSEPRPSEEQIAGWYISELSELRRFIRSLPLKDREQLATDRVAAKIKLWRKQRQLDEFFD